MQVAPDQTDGQLALLPGRDHMQGHVALTESPLGALHSMEGNTLAARKVL